ncbi:1-pyrroline-5-carboxylate dehydrogenase [Paenibacillus endophyticus]|uniref:L-glutamate gamma-semialdehyde dehydrogenase n=1 Tax=Paenibacillus endophyticus TaxID=1294268 RepID=A0A7W5C991_9BACL|nr:L-glutamate gamma-semialdehyde dehydrogenase [Paenibacillus endophyticus]MBB3153437.1 1-pyrroline-5-carboxylate dehydrogenase [Paenibacillus endophyticus]
MKERMETPFANELMTNFASEDNHAAFADALALVRAELGKEYPLHIAGHAVHTSDQIISINPAQTDEIVGKVSKASRELAEQAMNAALTAFESWKNTTVWERASCLMNAAALMRERKHYFSAWLVIESGKNWAEADADTAEAIDFMDYYAREMVKLAETNEHKPLVKLPGEDNRLSYIPLGVGIVIPPWNFPLAICAGMATASIVAGNTIILKPASTTPIIAYKFYELMVESGMPADVMQYLPGSGAEIGDYLTSHPKTRFVSFTGSKEIGLRINRLAAEQAPGQIWMKRVVAEMGGKDGIVVDETANIDAAADAIVASAFGFQGQKCSAGSRAIVVADVYDELVEKVKDRTSRLIMGSPEDNAAVGPVIDKSSFDKIMKAIEIGKSEARLLIGGNKGLEGGYFIEPTVFADAGPDDYLMQEEIFGPVLAIAKAESWQEAISMYNHTEFGLTGAYFSSDEERIQTALQDMHCGNLYINRKCTGALVGVHPFGGFNMSGTDSKAGGHDYMLLFTQAKLTSIKV